jgi:thioredoxin-like negative regulator of GroEL
MLPLAQSIKKLHKAIETAEKAINEDRYADAAERFVKLMDQTTGIPNYQADFARRLCTSFLKVWDR